MKINGKIIDDFTAAYLECALWSSHRDCDSDCNGGDDCQDNFDQFSIYDFDDSALETMIFDCDEFRKMAGELIADELCYTDCDYEKQAGHDFWLTRCGHGCGFWEKYDWQPAAGKILTKLCKKFGEIDLYHVGGKVFVL